MSRVEGQRGLSISGPCFLEGVGKILGRRRRKTPGRVQPVEMFGAVTQILAGVAMTWLGAEMLVRGSSRVALRLGVRPMVVGMTIVAFGTSMPEAVASLTAARMGSGGLALGNILGSNIANIGLILALLALVRPIEVSWRRLRGEVKILLMVTTLAVVLALLPRGYGLVDGCFLLVGLALFLRHYLLDTQRTRHDVLAQTAPGARGRHELLRSTVLVVAGLVLLVTGASILVRGARSVATLLGVAEDVVGATMVAVGTSLPELAASIVALLRNEHEIGVGNILGSNIFNLLFVLGLTAVAGGSTIPYNANTTVLLGAMVFFTLAVIPILKRHGRVERPEASVLLAFYLVFSVLVYYR